MGKLADLVKLSGKESTSISFEQIRDAGNAELNELKSIIYKMNSMANKRIDRMEKSGIDVSAYGRFSAKGINNINDAKKAFNDVKTFLNAKDKSLQGRSDMRATSIHNLQEETGDMFSKEDIAWLKNSDNYDRFWRAFNELSKKEGYNVNYKYAVLTELKQVAMKTGGSVEDLVTAMEGKLDMIYEQEQAAMNEYADTLNPIE